MIGSINSPRSSLSSQWFAIPVRIEAWSNSSFEESGTGNAYEVGSEPAKCESPATASRCDLPLAISVESASPAECRLVEAVLAGSLLVSCPQSS
jgi:hypothetical protein